MKPNSWHTRASGCHVASLGTYQAEGDPPDHSEHLLAFGPLTRREKLAIGARFGDANRSGVPKSDHVMVVRFDEKRDEGIALELFFHDAQQTRLHAWGVRAQTDGALRKFKRILWIARAADDLEPLVGTVKHGA